ncbi:MAG: NAD(P)/FAD-dependent oxidoreductase [Hyphomicrobiaceae bacterium]|nr:NAD(P)/FAD-dependent oxidoreductase [Hyphomicrobiaceae bacterium]
MSADVQTIVIGAGAIGLASARALALKGQDVLVVEQHNKIGAETSSRNSEVVHAGLYYPESSSRAIHCVKGKRLLYRFCRDHGVEYKRCGKIIVSTSQCQLEKLDALQAAASKNNVNDLIRLSPKDINLIEPKVHCTGGLLSPSTGVIESHSFMQALQGEAESHGAQVVLGCQVRRLWSHINDCNLAIELTDGDFVKCQKLILSAGLHATDLASTLIFDSDYVLPHTYYAKGQYYAFSEQSPFSRHIYPLPDGAWLGLHATVDISGRCKFGPDIEWVDKIDYNLETGNLDSVIELIRSYYPELDATKLYPDYCGIRPKLYRQGETPKDFMIHGPDEHKIDGLVMLFGIDSPGLTSCMSIAEEVVKKLN